MQNWTSISLLLSYKEKHLQIYTLKVIRLIIKFISRVRFDFSYNEFKYALNIHFVYSTAIVAEYVVGCLFKCFKEHFQRPIYKEQCENNSLWQI